MYGLSFVSVYKRRKSIGERVGYTVHIHYGWSASLTVRDTCEKLNAVRNNMNTQGKSFAKWS